MREAPANESLTLRKWLINKVIIEPGFLVLNQTRFSSFLILRVGNIASFFLLGKQEEGGNAGYFHAHTIDWILNWELNNWQKDSPPIKCLSVAKTFSEERMMRNKI